VSVLYLMSTEPIVYRVALVSAPCWPAHLQPAVSTLRLSSWILQQLGVSLGQHHGPPAQYNYRSDASDPSRSQTAGQGDL